jgi:hypothetical protein
MPQSAIPQFAIPQYQYQYLYQPPLFDNFCSFFIFKIGHKMQNSGKAEAQFW